MSQYTKLAIRVALLSLLIYATILTIIILLTNG